MAVARLALLSVLAMLGAMLAAASQEPVMTRTGEPIAPIPDRRASRSPPRLRLGERLFRDVRLSRDNRLACTSCHQLDQGGDDGQARSIGADGRPLDFNTPTVFNAALSFRLNWRGNFRTLEEQAEVVLLDPRLMGTSWTALISKLRADQTVQRRVRRRLWPTAGAAARARCAGRLRAFPGHAAGAVRSLSARRKRCHRARGEAWL